MSDSVRPHRWQPTRLCRPWDSPGKIHWSGLPFPPPMHESESEVTQSCPWGHKELDRTMQLSLSLSLYHRPVVKNPPANAGDVRDMGLIPGLERSPGEGHCHSFQYSCLENPHGQRSLLGSWGHRVRHTLTKLT